MPPVPPRSVPPGRFQPTDGRIRWIGREPGQVSARDHRSGLQGRWRGPSRIPYFSLESLAGNEDGGPETNLCLPGFPSKREVPRPCLTHAVDPRIAGDASYDSSEGDSNEFLRKIWGEKVFIAAGGYTPQTAAEAVEAKGGLVAFGRHYISNVSFIWTTKLCGLDRSCPDCSL
jgi:hypothetical protein